MIDSYEDAWEYLKILVDESYKICNEINTNKLIMLMEQIEGKINSMTQRDIYEKIKELEDKIKLAPEKHDLIHKDNNYWYLKGQIDILKSLND